MRGIASALNMRGLATLVLAPMLLATAASCKGGPTQPTFDELVGIYTGTWRGSINGFEVVLDVKAERGQPFDGGLVGLGGTATARNPATGESHDLTIFGQAVGPSSTWFRLAIPMAVGPGGVIVKFEQGTGEFRGAVASDRRTWPGHWTSTTHADGAPIFGPGGGAVTLTKD